MVQAVCVSKLTHHLAASALHAQLTPSQRQTLVAETVLTMACLLQHSNRNETKGVRAI